MRATTDMDESLKKEIEKMAEKNNWSFSYMCYVLLRQAVNEKNRKKRSANKDNSTHNPADSRSGNEGR